MSTTDLDVLFAWALQQEAQNPTIEISGLSSVAIFPPASGYGTGVLSYTAGHWTNVGTPQLPRWIEVPASFSGFLRMPKPAFAPDARPPYDFGEQNEAFLLAARPPLQFPIEDVYTVTFGEPPTKFTALGAPASLPSGPVPTGDANGWVNCIGQGDAFSFRFAAQ